MFINEVENIVGLSKKSIRYYEENGLLSPKRNNINDYRIYNEDDINKLKIIKFLRELDVPIRDLKLLSDGSISLKECLQERVLKINELENEYKRVKSLCEEIIESDDTFNSIDINKYFREIRVLNKEGFTMHEVKSNKGKKIFGAIMSSLLFSFIFIILIITMIYFEITMEDKLPMVFFIILLLIFLIPVISVCYNLIVRIKEILGGEEDEASKY